MKKKKTFSDEIWIVAKNEKTITFSDEIEISSLFVDYKQGRQNEKLGHEFN